MTKPKLLVEINERFKTGQHITLKEADYLKRACFLWLNYLTSTKSDTPQVQQEMVRRIKLIDRYVANYTHLQ